MKSKEMKSQPANRFIAYTVVLNLLICIFLLVWNFVGADSSRIVYVDAIKLLSGYKGMEVARKDYDVKVSGWNANLDTLKMELDAKFKEYELKKSKLSSRELALMEELLEAKRQQFIDYQGLISEKVKKEDQELTAQVYEKVNEYIKKHGQEKGYDFILGANQYGGIAYASTATDITAEVLAGLNAEFAK